MKTLVNCLSLTVLRTIVLTVLSMFTLLGFSQDFVNGDFEFSTNCSVSTCSGANNAISCVDDWWYFDTPGSTDFASLRYLCFGMTTWQNDCSKGERGLWLQQGNPLTSVPNNTQRYATQNPYHNGNPNALYKVNLDIIPFASEVGMYIHVFGSHNPTAASGAPVYLGATKDPVFFTNVNNCWNHDIYLNANICDGDVALTDFEYLVFGISSMSTSGLLSSPAPSVAAVMDNVSICKIFDFHLTDECEETCLVVNYNSSCEECVGEMCNFTGVVEFDDEDLVIFDYPETSWTNYQECFSIPGNATELEFEFAISPNGDADIYFICNYLDVTQCDDLDIESNTIWDVSINPIPFNHIKTLTVKSGATLTIDAGVTIFFCEQGELIIEPNARLNLYGALTSQCPNGWKGIQVQGNGSVNQFPQSGSYAQGRLYTYSGSKIENANIAVKLYGPDYQDAGGQVYAVGTHFLNNSRGIDFARFNNHWNNRPRDYHASITNCIFDITQDYILPIPFKEHIKM